MRLKAALLAQIGKLQLPTNFLDDLINQLGGPDAVAECTGRKGRVVADASGRCAHLDIKTQKPYPKNPMRYKLASRSQALTLSVQVRVSHSIEFTPRILGSFLPGARAYAPAPSVI